jgi:hypothetical protein
MSLSELLDKVQKEANESRIKYETLKHHYITICKTLHNLRHSERIEYENCMRVTCLTNRELIKKLEKE